MLAALRGRLHEPAQHWADPACRAGSTLPFCLPPLPLASRQQGGKLEVEPAVELVAPSAGCRAVAAATTAERTAVLWSDGTVAFYLVPGDKRPLVPGPDHAGPRRRAAVQRRLAGFRLPAGKQKGGGGKKRGAAAEPEAAAGGVAMAAMGEKQVAVVGWAAGSEGEGSRAS